MSIIKRSRSRSRSPSLALQAMPDPDSYQMQDYLHSFNQFNAARSTKNDSVVYVDHLDKQTDPTEFIQLLSSVMKKLELLRREGDPVLKYWRPKAVSFIFLEFRSVEEATSALILSGMSYKGKELRISRPKSYSGSQPIQSADMSVLFGNYASKNMSRKSLEDLAGATAAPTRKVDAPSNILKLKHILCPADFKSDSEFLELEEDVRAECREFGTVVSMCSPRPGAKGSGNIYVEFLEVEQAMKARSALSTKRFNGKWVAAAFHPEVMYAARDFRELWELSC